MDNKKARILLVNDSFHILGIMQKLIEVEDDLVVAGKARNGREALSAIENESFDLVVLDTRMPYMDGISTLKGIMRSKPTSVLICAPDDPSANADAVLCLTKGATDAMVFPEKIDPLKMTEALSDFTARVRSCAKVKAIRILKNTLEYDGYGTTTVQRSRTRTRNHSFEKISGVASRVCAIGASTGGPQAIKHIMSSIPENLDCAFLVTQHMPERFTPEFAKNLSYVTRMPVVQAQHGQTILNNTVYVAPGGTNIYVDEKKRVYLRSDDLDETRASPSIDELFISTANTFREKTIGLVLTGMGWDGKRGVVAIKNRGGHTIAQDPNSSLLDSMPREAVSTGVMDKVLLLEDIPAYIGKILERHPR
ncbi:MAG TPA: chemotaxis protein CheB [Caldisericia bacterium]|nr:chemotaxis protein CheB [Caldisericia bacterium]HPF49695.1 chemotaxis protein CheB [Caldisericia bacterium]HPI84532.1 chemotaxis protein CheB [Caldisericia bacterium]HPQ93647.1 chemotaxis protein CheB [Caldisericia bacterium]HRV74789.1 chemotaxis protein CheB [Caldisericia bacterium]